MTTNEQKAALYNLRLAVITAIEAGESRGIVTSVVNDTLFGIEHLGMEYVKDDTKAELAKLTKEIES